MYSLCQQTVSNLNLKWLVHSSIFLYFLINVSDIILLTFCYCPMLQLSWFFSSGTTSKSSSKTNCWDNGNGFLILYHTAAVLDYHLKSVCCWIISCFTKNFRNATQRKCNRCERTCSLEKRLMRAVLNARSFEIILQIWSLSTLSWPWWVIANGIL